MECLKEMASAIGPDLEFNELDTSDDVGFDDFGHFAFLLSDQQFCNRFYNNGAAGVNLARKQRVRFDLRLVEDVAQSDMRATS